MLCRGICLKDGRPDETLSGSGLQAQPVECHYRARKNCYFCLEIKKICAQSSMWVDNFHRGNTQLLCSLTYKKSAQSYKLLCGASDNYRDKTECMSVEV